VVGGGWWWVVVGDGWWVVVGGWCLVEVEVKEPNVQGLTERPAPKPMNGTHCG
jgi:hypothetical protein